MVEVYFVPSQLPRTMKRDEWQRVWREVREAKAYYKSINVKKAELLKIVTNPKMRQDLIDDMIYPPLILGPYMGTIK